MRRIRNKKLIWGVAGTGRIVEHSFLPAINFLKRSTVASIYGHNLHRAKLLATKTPNATAFDDFDKFLEQDFDVLYVASSNDYHYEQVLKAAKKGKHILCEKPLALTSEQAKEMVKVCEENNVKLAVNYIFRFHPLIKKAKELVDNQYIGKIISIYSNFHIDFPPSDNYRYDKNKGGGALLDLGTHMIDLFRYIGGEFELLHGYVDNLLYNTDVDDFAGATVKFNNGFYGNFQVSFDSKRSPNRLVIIGHKGTISIDDLIGKKFVPSKLIIEIEGERKKVFRRKTNKFLSAMRWYQKYYLKNIEPEVTGYDGYINMKIMEKIKNFGKNEIE